MSSASGVPHRPAETDRYSNKNEVGSLGDKCQPLRKKMRIVMTNSARRHGMTLNYGENHSVYLPKQ